MHRQPTWAVAWGAECQAALSVAAGACNGHAKLTGRVCTELLLIMPSISGIVTGWGLRLLLAACRGPCWEQTLQGASADVLCHRHSPSPRTTWTTA